MDMDGIKNELGMAGFDGPDVDMRTAAQALTKPQQQTERDSVSAFSGARAQEAQQPAGEFDFFQMLGALFGGGFAQGNGKDAANTFDLFSILSSIFDFAGKGAEKKEAAPEDDVAPEEAAAPKAKPQAPKNEQRVGVREQVQTSGEFGDEHFKAKGRAAAEAHAEAKSFSESFTDGSSVGVRGGAEASVGASAEAEGSIQTDIGSVDGRARISAEAYARVMGEAQAGPTGLSATGKAETGVMARGEAESNVNLADGLIKGHAEAQAEAGAGAQATGTAGVSFNPVNAVVNAKAESFAGARAGYSAQGGVAGIGYGIEAEVWAGAGIKAEINGGLDKEGKFKLEFAFGVAVGVGAQVKFNIEIDTKEVAKAIGKVLGGAGSIFGAIFKGVAGLFGGGKGDGTHAAKCIESGINRMAPMIDQAVGKATEQTGKSDQQQEDKRLEQDEAARATERKARSRSNVTTQQTSGTLLAGSLS